MPNEGALYRNLAHLDSLAFLSLSRVCPITKQYVFHTYFLCKHPAVSNPTTTCNRVLPADVASSLGSGQLLLHLPLKRRHNVTHTTALTDYDNYTDNS